jgi:YesN/AraC family two-component response regulator
MAEKKCILLVDDDPLVRGLIRDVLKGEKYSVLEAACYSEALRHLDNSFHLALIDYSLPEHNGLDVLKAVRKKHPAMPAILITGYGSESVAIKALRAGVNDYLKKPLSLGYLVDRVSELLEREGRAAGRNREPETVENRDVFIVDAAAAYINENHAERLSLDKLATVTCMNKYKLCRLFKERHKFGFVEYLNGVRIKKAVELLKNPDLSVTDIAFTVGYGSIQHFERVFNKFYGISPKAYRGKARQRAADNPDIISE